MWQPRTHSWVLIDFGLAAPIGEDALVGFTPTYAAPEVLAASKLGTRSMRADAAVDAWALGVIAFELLIQRPAFGAFSATTQVRSLLCCCSMGGQQCVPCADRM